MIDSLALGLSEAQYVALYQAIKNRSLKEINQALNSSFPYLDQELYNALLLHAVLHGPLELVALLSSNSGDVNMRVPLESGGPELLRVAIERRIENKDKCVNLLMNYGALLNRHHELSNTKGLKSTTLQRLSLRNIGPIEPPNYFHFAINLLIGNQIKLTPEMVDDLLKNFSNADAIVCTINFLIAHHCLHFLNSPRFFQAILKAKAPSGNYFTSVRFVERVEQISEHFEEVIQHLISEQIWDKLAIVKHFQHYYFTHFMDESYEIIVRNWLEAYAKDFPDKPNPLLVLAVKRKGINQLADGIIRLFSPKWQGEIEYEITESLELITLHLIEEKWPPLLLSIKNDLNDFLKVDLKGAHGTFR